MAVEIPNFHGNYPSAGELIGPAWRAGYLELLKSYPRWIPSESMTFVMTREGIVKITAEGLLRQARKRKIIEVRYRKRGQPLRQRAEYRVVPPASR